MKKLVSIILLLMIIGISSITSWAGDIDRISDSLSHYGLGVEYEEQGRYQEAIAEYKEALRIDPDYILARNHLKRLEQKTVSPKAGELEDAQEKVRQNPNDAFAHHRLGFTYNSLHRYQEAIAPLKEAIRLESDNALTHSNLGFSYNNLGRYQEAIASYKEAIRINPDDADVHYYIGETYEKLGRNNEAIAEYKEVLRIKPNHLWASVYLNDLQQSQKRQVTSTPPLSPSKKKLHHAQEQVRLYPDNAGVHLILGDLYEKRGRIDEAIVSFKEAVRLNPNNADIHMVLGHAYTKADQYRDAIASIKEAIRIRPNHSDTHYFLGMVYEKLSKYQEAIASYKEAIRINPDHVKALRSIGFAYEFMGRNNKAIAAYKEALRINPNLISVRNDLNALEQKLPGKEQLEIQLYKQKILSDPGNYMAHVNLGSAYKNNGQTEKAISEYEKAIIINPKDPLAYVGLGTLYFEFSAKYVNSRQTKKAKSELDKAIYQYKKASELDPNNPSFLYTLGTLYDFNNEGSNAIISVMEAKKLFLVKQDLKGIADCKRNLREYFERYKFKPEDFEGAEVAVASKEPSKIQQAVSGGTGFLFSSKDYVITNYHVVKGASLILAKFTNGQTVEAMIVAKDAKNDIAVLKLAKAPPLSAVPIKLGDSSQARMGEKIFTIGYPASKIMGEKPKYSEGVINSMTGLKDDPAFFQVSVPVQPGNSGGPLFNERGEVIGITTSSLSLLAIDAMGAIPQNVNYAIKASFVKNLLSTIPELMLSNTGIVVVPNEPENSLPNFIEQASKNIVLIEAK
jgi:tetratricopeptide (TPR) repeat protein